MNHPKRDDWHDADHDDRRDAVLFILFSLVTCLLMLVSALLLALAV